MMPSVQNNLSHNDPLPPVGGEESAETEAQGAVGPVTVLVSHCIAEGREKEFEQQLAEVSELLDRQPGFRGLNAYPPNVEDDEYEVALSFESNEDLAHWRTSDERKNWLEKIKPLEKEAPRAHILTGIEGWFTLPDQEGLKPPPRFKMAVVTWLAIFPLVTVANYTLAEWLSGLATWLRSGLIAAVLVALMTYVVMPRMTRLCSRFLYPKLHLPGRELDECDEPKNGK